MIADAEHLTAADGSALDGNGPEMPLLTGADHPTSDPTCFGIAPEQLQSENISTLESLPSGSKAKTFRVWNRSQAVSNRKRFEFGIVPKRFQTENISTWE